MRLGVGVATAVVKLLGRIAANDASGVEPAILDLRSIECRYDTVPDNVGRSFVDASEK